MTYFGNSVTEIYTTQEDYKPVHKSKILCSLVSVTTSSHCKLILFWNSKYLKSKSNISKYTIWDLEDWRVSIYVKFQFEFQELYISTKFLAQHLDERLITRENNLKTVKLQPKISNFENEKIKFKLLQNWKFLMELTPLGHQNFFHILFWENFKSS